MATLTVQILPANGQGLDDLVFTAATAGGDEFTNTGNELVIVKAGASTTTETAQLEGVPSADSGRDGTATLDPTAVGDICIAGPFKPRNWNTSTGVLQITYPGGAPASTLEVAIVRFRGA